MSFTIVDTRHSASEVVRALGHSINGRGIAQAREYLISNDVDISHWTKNESTILKITKVCSISFVKPKYNETVTCGYSYANTYFRSEKDNPNWKDNAIISYREKALNYYGRYCNKCGYSEESALVVHHKDSNRQNNISK